VTDGRPGACGDPPVPLLTRRAASLAVPTLLAAVTALALAGCDSAKERRISPTRGATPSVSPAASGGPVVVGPGRPSTPKPSLKP